MKKLILAAALCLSFVSVGAAQPKVVGKKHAKVLVTKTAKLECVHMRTVSICTVR